jgi:hypothetical protein
MSVPRSVLRSRAPSRRLVRLPLLVLIPSALAAASSGAQASERAAGSSSSPALTAGVLGDMDGDGLADIALTGGTDWNTIPIAHSRGDGTFYVTNSGYGSSNSLPFAAQQGVTPVAGDFDGDGRTDLALTGGAGWNTLPVAFSLGDGTFSVTNIAIDNFASYAAAPAVRAVAGDFNGDGRSDIALTGGSQWNTVPIAFSNGDGTFYVTNSAITNFASYGQEAGARLLAGDFNGDGKTDLALTGGAWNTVPVAFSNGDGTFRVTNDWVAAIPGYAAEGALAVAGDLNGDGYADIALTGVTGWNTIPVAFSNGDGTFHVTNTPAPNFPVWAAAGAQAVAADFNGDGKVDVALTGVAGWNTVPVAFSNGDGSFRIVNDAVSNFPLWATVSLAVSASEARF